MVNFKKDKIKKKELIGFGQKIPSCYINKRGVVKYKLTLPLPLDLVKRLKIQAILADKSLSAFIQERLEK